MSSWRHPNQRSPSELPPELRRAPVPAGVCEWVRRVTGSRVVGVRRLPGASSAAVHLVRLADGRSLVLRRYVWEGFLTLEPDVPRREVEAIGYARGHGLPAPEVVASDIEGREVGDGVPVLLMNRVPGRAQASPDVRALAALAAQVHARSGNDFPHRFFPWCRDTSTRPPRASHHPEIWEQAQHLWRTAEPPYEPCFVHRDFHPGNVLWSRGALTGLVDWANSCVGPAGIDVATCRWNLQDWADEQAADAFVAAYEEITGRRHHPYWDVAKLVENDWDQIESPRRVLATEAMLEQALPRLLQVLQQSPDRDG